MNDLYKPSKETVENAHINKIKYEEMYTESISDWQQQLNESIIEMKKK